MKYKVLICLCYFLVPFFFDCLTSHIFHVFTARSLLLFYIHFLVCSICPESLMLQFKASELRTIDDDMYDSCLLLLYMLHLHHIFMLLVTLRQQRSNSDNLRIRQVSLTHIICKILYCHLRLISHFSIKFHAACSAYAWDGGMKRREGKNAKTEKLWK